MSIGRCVFIAWRTFYTSYCISRTLLSLQIPWELLPPTELQDEIPKKSRAASSISHSSNSRKSTKGKRRTGPLCKLISLLVNALIFQTGHVVRPRLRLASKNNKNTTTKKKKKKKNTTKGREGAEEAEEGEGEEEEEEEEEEEKQEVANVAGDSDSGSRGLRLFRFFINAYRPFSRVSPFSVDPIKGPNRRVSVINLLPVDLITGSPRVTFPRFLFISVLCSRFDATSLIDRSRFEAFLFLQYSRCSIFLHPSAREQFLNIKRNCIVIHWVNIFFNRKVPNVWS